jgi:hypothetical protein
MSIHLPGEKVEAPQISSLSVSSVFSVVVLSVGLNLAKGLDHGVHGRRKGSALGDPRV